MKFVCTGVYINQNRKLQVDFRISDAQFDVYMAKEICRGFEDDGLILDSINTSYEEDLSGTPSFFDSYTKHHNIHNVCELSDDYWDSYFMADYIHPGSDKKERSIFSITSWYLSSSIFISYDISRYKYCFVPGVADDRELSLGELIGLFKGKSDSDECKSFAMAVAAISNESFDAAYQLLYKNGWNKEATTLLPKSYYNQLALMKGNMLLNQGKYEEAKSSFSKAIDLKEGHEGVQETTYQQAVDELKKGNYHRAFELLVEIVEYKDTYRILCDTQFSRINNSNMRKSSQIVLFGHNGYIPIPWIVLETTNGKSLLLSKYPLWCDSFHDTYTGVDWAHSSLCKKLNRTFPKEAFNFKERLRILANEDPKNRVMLLSCHDKDYIDRIVGPFTKNDAILFESLNDRRKYFEGIDSWWLRDTKNPEPRAYCVLELKNEKRILDEGVKCSYWVRPAIWVRTNKEDNVL